MKYSKQITVIVFVAMASFTGAQNKAASNSSNYSTPVIIRGDSNLLINPCRNTIYGGIGLGGNIPIDNPTLSMVGGFEHFMNLHWALGVEVQNTSTILDMYPPSQLSIQYAFNTFFIGARSEYCFVVHRNFDLYTGLEFGYYRYTEKYTATEKDKLNTTSLLGKGDGLEVNEFIGAKYYFSNHLGIYTEFRLMEYSNLKYNTLPYSVYPAGGLLILGFIIKL